MILSALKRVREIRLAEVGRVAVYLTAATPLVLLRGFFFPFVTTRNIFFRFCVEIAVFTILARGVRRLRDIEVRDDPILKWFLAFVLALFVAAIFGASRWHSFFGDFERMGGVLAWLHLFVFYFVLRVLMRDGDWPILFRWFVIAADFVVAWGGLEFLPQSLRNPLFQTTLSTGSTIGNQGLLGPYLLLTLGLSAWLWRTEKRPFWRAFAAVSACILLFGIAGARNRSSELGLLFGFLVGSVVLILLEKNRRAIAKKYAVVVTLGLGVMAVLWYSVSAQAPKVANAVGGRWKGFTASPIDYSRTIEWSIALQGFRDRPLLGYGPENHQVVSSHHFDPRIYAVLGEGIFDRTHNAWLELLATSGIAGFITLIGVWVAAIFTLRRGAREERFSAGETAILAATLTGYAVYLTFWFFDINTVVVWIALLAFITSRKAPALEVGADRSVGPRHQLSWALAGLVILVAYLQGVVPLQAARTLSNAVTPGVFEYRLMEYQKVMNSASPQTLHTFPLYYQFLRNSAPLISAEANPLARREFDLAMQRGVLEAERSIARNPEDDRSYVDAGRLFALAGVYYRDRRYIERAKLNFARAVRISPRRPDARILLSSVLVSLRDNSKAISQLDSAMKLAPDYPAAYLYAARMELRRGNADSAASLLLVAIAHRPVPLEAAVLGVVDTLQARGKYARAAELSRRFLERGYGDLERWEKLRPRPKPTFVEMNLADRLPILYLSAGEGVKAVEAAAAFRAFEPHASSSAAAFTSDVARGAAEGWKIQSMLYPLLNVSGTAMQVTK